jgi:hypothetical protein
MCCQSPHVFLIHLKFSLHVSASTRWTRWCSHPHISEAVFPSCSCAMMHESLVKHWFNCIRNCSLLILKHYETHPNRSYEILVADFSRTLIMGNMVWMGQLDWSSYLVCLRCCLMICLLLPHDVDPATLTRCQLVPVLLLTADQGLRVHVEVLWMYLGRITALIPLICWKYGLVSFSSVSIRLTNLINQHKPTQTTLGHFSWCHSRLSCL